MATPATANDTSLGPRSEAAFARARAVFPDGTTRVTIERSPAPRYMSHGEGAYLVDVDGRRFLDLNANFTTLIHGHAFGPVISTLERQLRRGSCFANPTEPEIALAELLCARVPGLERVRFVNTGTEAVMFAIKAARALTGRSGVAKIEGAYHGAYDWVEVSQASTPATWGAGDAPASTGYYAGMPQAVLDDVVALRFNDAEGARRLLAAHADRLACVIIDPMPSRAGLVAPEPGFIAALQETARAHGILVISDEVLNFRQAYEGASARYGIAPDLFTFGKIIGGGMPIGAIGGSAVTMKVFDASGGRPALPQGGTFSANPLSMVAGLASMQALDRPAFAHLDDLGARLRARLTEIIARRRAPLTVTGAASLFRIHPKRVAPRDFRESFTSPAETKVVVALSRHFAEAGIVLPAAACACLSTPMTASEIDLIAQVFASFIDRHGDLLAEIAR
ncbi:MAG: aspartate aminotransferase family protein [Alphaproteobacteria bacterium]|nr:aspartate aminotransferase family protein [Alphaproteobacteria bacterium]